MKRKLLTALMATVLIMPMGLQALASEEIVVEGGGWGHGIGMSQYGAKAMAELGSSATQIIQYFYSGVTIGTVGQGGLVGHAEPLRIGVAQNQTVVGFEVIGGPVNLCLGLDCSLTAQPGDGLVWSIQSNGAGSCQFFNGPTPVGIAGPCVATMTWSNQPDVRVSVPSLGRTYARGKILIAPAPAGKFHMLVEVGLEAYLYGLGEMPSSWPTAAIQAQAIAGRTYALFKAWKHRDLAADTVRMNACACHLYDSTVDQKYIGWAKEAEGTNGHWGNVWRAAVDATAGQAAVHTASAGRAIEAYYHSSSGGATENNEDVWGGSAYAYLRSVTDPGFTTWVTSINKATFATLLGFDNVFSAQILDTFESGSPNGILVSGLGGGVPKTTTFTGNEMRTKLGLLSHNIKGLTGFLPSFTNFSSGDFDGDGSDEVVALSSADGSIWVLDGLGNTTQWSTTAPGTWNLLRSGDFNGDGKDDIALYSSAGAWWVGTSDGTTFAMSKWTQFGTASGWQAHVVSDFDGDGKDDIAQFHPANGTWWVTRSTGTSFLNSLWADFTTASGWQAQLAGDFNGDGKDDIAQFHPANGTWWVSTSTGTGFTTKLWDDFATASGWQARLAGDFNGDGKDDIAQFHPGNGTWWVSTSTGTGFTTKLWADFATASGWQARLAGDFNGDGKDDIAQFHPGNGTWWVSTSTGTGLTTKLWDDFTIASGWSSQLVGDFDGDGLDDIANHHPANQTWWVSTSSGSSFITALWAP